MERLVTSESVEKAIFLGSLTLDTSASYIKAFSKIATPPINAIPLSTCFRSILEATALSEWILNPEIDCKEREKRQFVWWIESLDQQRKALESKPAPDDITQEIRDRIDKVKFEASISGFQVPTLSGTSNLPLGKMPKITDIIKIIPDREFLYRVSSGVQHGHSWAIEFAGYDRINTHDRATRLRPYIRPSYLYSLCHESVVSLSRPLWYLHKYLGLDQNGISEMLTKEFDSMQIPFDRRIWLSS